MLKRIVIKLGTNVVIEDGKDLPALERLRTIVSDIAALHKQGTEVVVVSSGAVGLGRDLLKGKVGRSLLEKQVCATVGQTALMDLWTRLLGEHQILPAQLLLTAHDFERRESYLNVHQTIDQLLEIGVVPVINENDATSVSEIREDTQSSFGDNDRLSALVSARIGAQRLLILTTTDGVYSDNPETNPNAQRLERVSTLEELNTITTTGTSTGGRGGMRAKLEAVRIASLCGVTVQIATGFVPSPVSRALAQDAGTIISAQRSVPLRKGWIGHSSGYRGVLVINQGARQALLLSGSSLLPVGIVKLRGEFSRFDVVQIEDEEGNQIGRGLSSFSSHDLQRYTGKKSAEIALLAGSATISTEAVHRDNLVLFLDESDV